MRVVRVSQEGFATPRLGVLIDDEVHLADEGETVLGVLQRDGALTSISRSGEVVKASEVSFEAPIERATSVRDFTGFLQHIRNGRAARGVFDELLPVWTSRPTMFFVNPSALFASRAPVPIQPECTAWDFEFEIGAVIGRAGSNLTPEGAADHIAGYVIYCDWTSRDVAVEERAMQIGIGKAKDAGITLGPWILTGEEAASVRRDDGFEFDVTIDVNGERYLSTAFKGMNWTFEQIVAYASFGASIEVGDIIASGTVPGGCLYESSSSDTFRGYLTPGDCVRFDAAALGTMDVEILPSPSAPSWRG